MRDGRVELAEEDRFFGDRYVLLCAVVDVVHANTDQLLRAGDGRSELVLVGIEDALARRHRIFYDSDSMLRVQEERGIGRTNVSGFFVFVEGGEYV